MKLITQTPKKVLKAFLRQKPLRSEIDLFKCNLIALLDKISVIEKQPKDESEEHLKNNLRDFLRDTYYKDTNAINTKDKKDLVIHLGKTTDSEVGVIIEAKRPTNVNEMVSVDSPNKKALHELILYYLDERNKIGNIQLKQLVITNIYEWFIIDANYFDKHIYRNTQIRKLYETKINDHKDNPFFYEEVAKIIQKSDLEIPCIYFDIRQYDTILRNDKKEDDRELIALLKILSPQHLLKVATLNDSNSLDERFYKELLHIIGLEEAKEGSKNIIRRKKENRNLTSLIELTIDAIDTEDTLHRLPDQTIYGETREERIFNIALELCITWINRVLFLKLLEGQLVTYHQGNKDLCFLNAETIHDFDELFKLFHKVLAVNLKVRTDAIKIKYSRVPYLNSSLFEISELEDQIIKINSLDNDGQLELINNTILKETKKKVDKLPTLYYLFAFLDAYDFASEGSEDIQEDNKTIINASVLGKVFEKINGYKDGSIFTPGFITMYMCRQSIRRAVVEKFNDYCLKNGLSDIKITSIEDVYELIGRKITKQKANEIINSLKICDPAVGSGHFLVSALNEIIAIKSELGILMDKTGKTLRDYKAEVINDELYVYDIETEEQIKYIVPDTKSMNVRYNFGGDKIQINKKTNSERQRVFETLFHEKQTIIENCLFGVDINPNSVKICRLRLWVELLKNAYYKEDTDFLELETLPNIDINIKCGNSLLSRFAIDVNLKQIVKTTKWTIFSYLNAVSAYKKCTDRTARKELEKFIEEIKLNYKTNIQQNNPTLQKYYKLKREYDYLYPENGLFAHEPEINYGNGEKREQKKQALKEEIEQIQKSINDEKRFFEFNNAFEWRFEFPEVLNDNGDFEGFDVVIGNPPYFSLSKIKELAGYFQNAGYQTYSKSSDVYCLFYERGNQILKSQGILTYITSNSWLRAIYGDVLKKFFTQNMQPIDLLNIEDIQVFAEATVESSILTLQKTKNNSPFLVANLSCDYVIGSSLSDYFKEKSFEYKIPETSEWSIGNEATGMLKEKIEKNSNLLKEFDIRINFGIKTGYNAAFIIDEETKNKLITEDPNCAEIIRPILRGRDLKKYSYEFDNFYLVNAHNGLKQKNIMRVDLENQYPVLFNYLKSFLPNVEVRYDKGDHWSNLRNCAYLEDFEKPKIVWGEISDKPKFAYDDCNYYAEATTFFMTGDKLKYLLAILNSKVSEWYFNQIGTTTGMGTNRWKKYKIEILPIKVPTENMQLKIESLVEKILVLKKLNASNDTTVLESEIDELVYQLYDISPEEQKIIEGN